MRSLIDFCPLENGSGLIKTNSGVRLLSARDLVDICHTWPHALANKAWTRIFCLQNANLRYLVIDVAHARQQSRAFNRTVTLHRLVRFVETTTLTLRVRVRSSATQRSMQTNKARENKLETRWIICGKHFHKPADSSFQNARVTSRGRYHRNVNARPIDGRILATLVVRPKINGAF